MGCTCANVRASVFYVQKLWYSKSGACSTVAGTQTNTSSRRRPDTKTILAINNRSRGAIASETPCCYAQAKCRPYTCGATEKYDGVFCIRSQKYLTCCGKAKAKRCPGRRRHA